MWSSQWCYASCPGFQSWEPLLGRGEKENTTEMINEYKKIFKISIVRTFNSVIANIVAMFKHSSSLGQQKMKVASLIGTFHCTGKIFAAQLDSVNNLIAYNRRQGLRFEIMHMFTLPRNPLSPQFTAASRGGTRQSLPKWCLFCCCDGLLSTTYFFGATG